jgi:hypothetical protein
MNVKREMPSMRRAATLTGWILLAQVFALAADLPAGWVKAGSHPTEYGMGVDTTTRRTGGRRVGLSKRRPPSCTASAH